MARKKVTDEEVEIVRRMQVDFPYYAPINLRIVPKAGGLVPLELNMFQLYVHDKLEKQLAERGYVRYLILKPRQLGCSTYIEGRYYHKVTLAKTVVEDGWGKEIVIEPGGRTCLIMTHEDGATTNLFRMTKTYHDNAVEDLKPETRASNAIELLFDNEKGTGLKSRFKVQTAGAKGGRSITSHYLHLSEYAYYGDAGMNAVGGALESVPSEEPGLLGTEVIIETTANGLGEPFHRKWVESQQKESEGKTPEYMRVFFPWFWYLPYRRRVSDAESQDILATLDDKEKWLLDQKTFGGTLCGQTFKSEPVSVEQLAWRRWKTESLEPPPGMTKEDFFCQEYPSTADEAFVFSGSQVFNAAYIRAAKAECFEPSIIGGLERSTGKFIDNPLGNLKIWERPIRGQMYVIGADVAEGLTHGDFSSADVLHIPSGRQVAQWHGHTAPDLFGDILNHLGKFYGSLKPALLGVEANNHGHTTIARLKELRYPNLYMRDSVDGPSGKKVKKYGHLTTRASKNEIIDWLSAELREGMSNIYSYDTITELGTYIKLENGSYSAAPDCFDDRVISRAIAGKMLREIPQVARARSQSPNGYTMAA